MIKKRKIAVITGARAEYGILKPLLEGIKKSGDFKLELLAGGMHLLEKYGLTIREIEKDGFKISGKVKMYSGNIKNPLYYGKALGEGIKNFSKALLKIKPDIAAVFGDRLEPLAATLAAAALRLPIVHIHAGDKTDDGHIDEAITRSITRFSHLHFAPTEKCKARLIKMGEEPWRVYNVGALNIDSVLSEPKIKKEILFKKFNLEVSQKFILCLFHPVNLEIEKTREIMRKIVNALAELKIQTVIIYPNNDAGSGAIIKEIEKARNLPFVRVFPNLLHKEYLNLLRYADVLVGNSSSGVIEAPAMKLPVVNIGLRNVGREHAENIIFIEADRTKIVKAIKKALYDRTFKEKVKKCTNPYGNGGTSGRIVKILRKMKVDKKLLHKKITY